MIISHTCTASLHHFTSGCGIEASWPLNRTDIILVEEWAWHVHLLDRLISSLLCLPIMEWASVGRDLGWNNTSPEIQYLENQCFIYFIQFRGISCRKVNLVTVTPSIYFRLEAEA